MKYLKFIKIIGIAAFIYILSFLDYKTVFESLLHLNMYYIALFVLLWYVVLVIKVYRWHMVQNYFSRPLSFKENLWVFIETIYLSHVTPGKVGDMARIWIMDKYFDIPKKESTVAYIFDRIQDLFFMVLFVLYSTVFVIKIPISNYIYILFILFITGYIFKNKILSFFQHKIKLIETIKTDLIFEAKIFFINVLMFAFHFLEFYMLAKAMDITLEYNFIIALISISTLASIIPISVGGLGVREGVFIFLLATVGVSKESAVLLSLLDNVFFVAVFIVALYFFGRFFLAQPTPIKE